MSDKRKEKSSNVWDHFEDYIRGRTAMCKLCKKKLSYRTSISNLKKHLERRHPTVHYVRNKSTQELLETSTVTAENNTLDLTSDHEQVFEVDTETRDSSNHNPKPCQNEDEVYAEIIYYGDQNPLKIIKKETPPETKPLLPKSRPKRRKISEQSSSSDEPVVKRGSGKKHNEEIDKFGTYVSSLLKTVPSDVSMKLQMEIINLIMGEKIKA